MATLPPDQPIPTQNVTAGQPDAHPSTDVGAFGGHALALLAVGLYPIPCGGPDTKSPALNFRNWPDIPSADTIAALAADRRFAPAEVGILTGRGRHPVVVLDVDDVTQLPELIALFGRTPLMIETPSGGRHLYYAFSGETGRNLRRAGFKADIKGYNGFVVAPPSRRRATSQRPGGAYRIVSGGWRDLRHLPRMREEAWNDIRVRPRWKASGTTTLRSPGADHPKRPFEAGTRNDALFRAGLRTARRVRSEIELEAAMADLNHATCRPPLDPVEVERIAASAWRYETEGQNWSGTGGVSFARHEIDAIGDADALWLLVHLEFLHGARDTPFALQFRRMAAEDSIRGLGDHRLRKAAQRLEKSGFLIRCHAGAATREMPPSTGCGAQDRDRRACDFHAQYNGHAFAALAAGRDARPPKGAPAGRPPRAAASIAPGKPVGRPDPES